MGLDFDRGLNLTEQLQGSTKNLENLFDNQGDLDVDLIQRPRGIRVPHATFADALWISIKPKKITKQTKGARNEDAIQTTGEIKRENPQGLITSQGNLPTFKFLAPLELQENIVHVWEAYESIVTRLLQKGVDATKFISDILAVGRPLKAGLERTLQKIRSGEITGADVKTQLRNIVSGMTRSEVPRVKIDTPLVYQDSNRREYTFTFFLIDEGNSYRDVVWPVKLLEKYSSPAHGDNNPIAFEPPYIFEITTVPSTDFIRVKNAALVQVAPTYRHPYRNGYPTICELNLTFREIEPMYRRRLEEEGSGTVTVSITPSVRANIVQDITVLGISTRKWTERFSSKYHKVIGQYQTTGE